MAKLKDKILIIQPFIYHLFDRCFYFLLYENKT